MIDAIIDIREEHQPEPSVALAKSLVVWSGLLYRKVDYAGVVGVAGRAERMFAALTPPDLDGVASCLVNQGAALYELDRHAEAEQRFRRALAIEQALYGSHHPTVVNTLDHLATVVNASGRAEEAERLYRRALAIGEASHGPHHPTVARTLHCLAGLLRDAARADEAEPLCRRALAIEEGYYGPAHPTVAHVLITLAGLLRATERRAEAVPLVRRAANIFTRTLGDEHLHTQLVRDALASLSPELGRPTEDSP